MPKVNPNILRVERHRAPYSAVDRPRLHASERDVPFSQALIDDYTARLTDSTI